MNASEVASVINGRKFEEFRAHEQILADATALIDSMRGWLTEMLPLVSGATLKEPEVRLDGLAAEEKIKLPSLDLHVPRGMGQELILSIAPYEVLRRGVFRLATTPNLGKPARLFVRIGPADWRAVMHLDTPRESLEMRARIEQESFYDAVAEAVRE